MEKLGRGSGVIQRLCKKAELPTPKWHSDSTGVTLTLFATEVTKEVMRLIRVMYMEQSREEIMSLMELKNAEHFRKHYLKPALALKPSILEMTIPNKPTSRLQKYRLTTVSRFSIKLIIKLLKIFGI